MVNGINYTERTWGIELVSEINDLVKSGSYRPVVRADGERGLKGREGETSLFPDVLLLSGLKHFLMGWELKFPDTPITDPETIENAKRKAKRLGSNAFLIWNVNNAVLYVMDIPDEWTIVRSWSLQDPVERDRVEESRHQWRPLLKDILRAITEAFSERRIRDADLALTIGASTYREILDRSVADQAQLINARANQDTVFKAHLLVWAREGGTARNSISVEKAAKSLAENLIVNWVNKVIFSHQLKRVSEDAYRIDDLGVEATVPDYLDVFAEISDSSDFKSIFTPILGQETVSPVLFSQIAQLQAWLVSVTAEAGGEFDFSESLSGGLAQLRGKSSGQYATPRQLARFLVGLTVRHPREPVLDPCAGTGAIARAVMDLKMETGDPSPAATGTIWASDKFNVPIGLTGISLADPEAMHEVQQVFQSDVADLKPGREIRLADPTTGETVIRNLPELGAVVSNLPFIRFESLEESQDTEKLREFAGLGALELSKRADAYAYILPGLRHLIADDGKIGVIVSNSWMGTSWGRQFRNILLHFFDIEYLVFSQNKRWFSNAEVVTTILVLSRKGQGSEKTIVGTTLLPIDEWQDSLVDEMVDHLLVGRSGRGVQIEFVDNRWLSETSDMGLSWTAALGGAGLLDRLIASTVEACKYFTFQRGLRPGWEKFFFISAISTEAERIESEYLVPLLHRPAEAFQRVALSGVVPNYYFFSCEVSIEGLESLGHVGALEWIRRFAHQTNNKGLPLPQVLKGRPHWYSATQVEMGDFVMQMNPDAVLAIYRPQTTAGCSQRFISVSQRDRDADLELSHAVLNSVITYLWQEITGFPKGLGALDRNPSQLTAALRVPDVSDLGVADAQAIVLAFRKLAARPPLPIEEELRQEDRKNFDRVLFRTLGIEEDVEKTYELLLRLSSSRRSV